MIPDGDDTWLQRLISVLGQPEVGAVGAVSNNVFGFQRREGRNGVVVEDGRCPALIFFAGPLRKAAIERVGLLDERFSPGNYEDFDYSVRLAKAGWEMQVADGVWLEHVMHATHKDLRVDFNQLLSTNRNKFIEKWGIEVARNVGVAT